MNIYLIQAGVDYQGYTIIKAFEKEKDAIAFRDRCVKYHKKEPLIEDDNKWDEWFEKHKKWYKNHPAGECCANSDYFNIQKIKLTSSNKRLKLTRAAALAA